MRGVRPPLPLTPQVPAQATFSLWLCPFISEDELTRSEEHRSEVCRALNSEGYYL